MGDDLNIGLTITADGGDAKANIMEVHQAEKKLQDLDGMMKGQSFLGKLDIESAKAEVKVKSLTAQMGLARNGWEKAAVAGELMNANLTTQRQKMDGVISLGKGIAGLAAPYLAVGAAVAGVVTYLTDLAIKTAEVGDQFLKAAPALGMTVEDLSALRYVAERSNVQFEQLSIGLSTLNKNLVDASAGTGEAIGAFKTLNIELNNEHGSLKSNTEVLMEVADRFRLMADGATKAALAQKIFGESGTKLVPVLNQGRDGIEELKQRAEELGVVWSTTDAQAAAELRDATTDLKSAMAGLNQELGKELIPTLTRVVNVMTDGVGTINQYGSEWAGLWDTINPVHILIKGAIEQYRMFKALTTGGIYIAGDQPSYFDPNQYSSPAGPMPEQTTPTYKPTGSSSSSSGKESEKQKAEAARKERERLALEQMQWEQSEREARVASAQAEDQRLNEIALHQEEIGRERQELARDQADVMLTELQVRRDDEIAIAEEKAERLAELLEQEIVSEQEYNSAMLSLSADRIAAKRADMEAYGGLVAAIGKFGKDGAKVEAATKIPTETLAIIEEGARAASSLAIGDMRGAALHGTAALQHGLALREAAKIAGGGGSGGGGGGGAGGGGGGGRNRDRQPELAANNGPDFVRIKLEGLEGVKPDHFYTGEQLIAFGNALKDGYKEGSIPNAYEA